MTSRIAVLLLALLIGLAYAGCASSRSAATWRPGDAIICPRCGQGFPLPEKLEP